MKLKINLLLVLLGSCSAIPMISIISSSSSIVIANWLLVCNVLSGWRRIWTRSFFFHDQVTLFLKLIVLLFSWRVEPVVFILPLRSPKGEWGLFPQHTSLYTFTRSDVSVAMSKGRREGSAVAMCYRKGREL